MYGIVVTNVNLSDENSKGKSSKCDKKIVKGKWGQFCTDFALNLTYSTSRFSD